MSTAPGNGTIDSVLLALSARVGALESAQKQDRTENAKLLALVRDTRDICRRTNKALAELATAVNKLLKPKGRKA